MMQENDKKQPAVEPGKQPEAQPASQQQAPQADDNAASHPGRMDQEEGNMENGELGGGLRKED